MRHRRRSSNDLPTIPSEPKLTKSGSIQSNLKSLEISPIKKPSSLRRQKTQVVSPPPPNQLENTSSHPAKEKPEIKRLFSDVAKEKEFFSPVHIQDSPEPSTPPSPPMEDFDPFSLSFSPSDNEQLDLEDLNKTADPIWTLSLHDRTDPPTPPPLSQDRLSKTRSPTPDPEDFHTPYGRGTRIEERFTYDKIQFSWGVLELPKGHKDRIGSIVWEKRRFSKNAIENSSGRIYLFGDNDSDFNRPEDSSRVHFGGMARDYGPFDRTKAFGIVTTFYDRKRPNLDEFQEMLENQINQLREFVSLGLDVIIPSPNIDDLSGRHKEKYFKQGKQVINHNIGTGIADLPQDFLVLIEERFQEFCKNAIVFEKPKMKLTPNGEAEVPDALKHLLLVAERKLPALSQASKTSTEVQPSTSFSKSSKNESFNAESKMGSFNLQTQIFTNDDYGFMGSPVKRSEDEEKQGEAEEQKAPPPEEAPEQDSEDLLPDEQTPPPQPELLPKEKEVEKKGEAKEKKRKSDQTDYSRDRMSLLKRASTNSQRGSGEPKIGSGLLEGDSLFDVAREREIRQQEQAKKVEEERLMEEAKELTADDSNGELKPPFTLESTKSEPSPKTPKVKGEELTPPLFPEPKSPSKSPPKPAAAEPTQYSMSEIQLRKETNALDPKNNMFDNSEYVPEDSLPLSPEEVAPPSPLFSTGRKSPAKKPIKVKQEEFSPATRLFSTLGKTPSLVEAESPLLKRKKKRKMGMREHLSILSSQESDSAGDIEFEIPKKKMKIEVIEPSKPSQKPPKAKKRTSKRKSNLEVPSSKKRRVSPNDTPQENKQRKRSSKPKAKRKRKETKEKPSPPKKRKKPNASPKLSDIFDSKPNTGRKSYVTSRTNPPGRKSNISIGTFGDDSPEKAEQQKTEISIGTFGDDKAESKITIGTFSDMDDNKKVKPRKAEKKKPSKPKKTRKQKKCFEDIFFLITGSANLKAMKPLRSSKTRSKNRLDELTSAIKTNGGTILKNIRGIEKNELASVLKRHEQVAAHLAIQGKRKSQRNVDELQSHTGDKLIIVIALECKRTVKHLYALSRGLTSLKPAWVFECIKKKKIVSSYRFRLEAGQSTQDKLIAWKDGVKGKGLTLRSRQNLYPLPFKKRMLQGFVFCLSGPAASHGQFLPILVESGALIASNFQQLTGIRTQKEHECAVLHVDHERKPSTSIVRKCTLLSLDLISHEWLVDSLIHQQAQSFGGHPKYKRFG